MAKAFFIKVNGALHPHSDDDRELLKKIPPGTAVRLTYTKVRNYEFHKKYFAMINFAFENWPDDDNQVGTRNKETFRQELQVAAGFYDRHILIAGGTLLKSRSIAFDSMDETEFSDVYNRVLEVIARHVLKHFEDADQLRATMAQLEAFE